MFKITCRSENFWSQHKPEKIVYLFGGCVRDLVFNNFTTYDNINDIDINYTANYFNVVDSLLQTYPKLIISKRL